MLVPNGFRPQITTHFATETLNPVAQIALQHRKLLKNKRNTVNLADYQWSRRGKHGRSWPGKMRSVVSYPTDDFLIPYPEHVLTTERRSKFSPLLYSIQQKSPRTQVGEKRLTSVQYGNDVLFLSPFKEFNLIFSCVIDQYIGCILSGHKFSNREHLLICWIDELLNFFIYNFFSLRG